MPKVRIYQREANNLKSDSLFNFVGKSTFFSGSCLAKYDWTIIPNLRERYVVLEQCVELHTYLSLQNFSEHSSALAFTGTHIALILVR